MNAQEIKERISQYFTKKGMCVHFEVGLNSWGRLRADLVALSMRGHLTVVEVKSSKRDFLTDKKWRGYLKFCHQYFFAMTEDVYEEVIERIPADVGVLVIYPKVYPSGRTLMKVRVAQRNRRKELDPDLVLNLAIRMAFKSSDRNRYKRS